ATGIDLIVGKIREVFHHSPMYEAAATLPIVLRRCVGYNWHILEIRKLTFPFPRQGVHVKVPWTPPTPVQTHGASVTTGDHVFHHGLDGCKAGSAGQKHCGLATFPEEERAQGRFNAQDFTHFHLRFTYAKNVIGERATGCMRSEERRVGKECRSRWSPHHQKEQERSRERVWTE